MNYFEYIHLFPPGINCGVVDPPGEANHTKKTAKAPGY